MLELGLLIAFLVAVWSLSIVAVLSFTRLRSFLRWVQALSLFPLMVALVWGVTMLAARFTPELGVWMELSSPKVHLLVSAVLALAFLIPFAVTLFWLWFKSLAYLDARLQ